MKKMILAALAGATLLAGCGEYGGGRVNSASYSRYDYNNPDPQYGGYYADRYYRNDSRRYRERRLNSSDRVYRGQNGKYYCRHDDGTTGLVVGGVAGGVLGNIIAPGGSELLGTLLGAAGGAVAGQAIDKSDSNCR